MIVDSSVKINDQIKDKVKLYSLPITEMAVKVAGSEIVTNMVTLGALVAITKAVSREALEKAMFSRIPKGTEEVNMKALAQGFALAEYLV